MSHPRLWYPVGHGSQPLYRLEVSLKQGDTVIDSQSRLIGFRCVERHGLFDYSINGKHVKLWGANFTPMPVGGHRWDEAMCEKLFDHAVHCNFNTLRMWGPGHPWDEHALEAADRRGLLLWMEFAHTGAPFPDDEAFRNQCRDEAEYWLKEWKHHPSILLWCGGNETFLGLNIDRPNMHQGDVSIFLETYAELCASLDPERAYIPNSPHGGDYGNCTWEGDSHIRSYEWFQSGMEFPVMPSEHVRVTIPLKKTLQHHLGEDLRWPRQHVALRSEYNDPVLPASWDMLSPNRNWVLNRLGFTGDYFDPDGTPESLLFVMGAGTSRYIRRTIERFRRGKPSWDARGKRRVLGHYWWKFNDTFPMIYASLVDDQLEPNMSYYAMRRACQPLLVSIEVADSINLWIVNDTGAEVEGILRVRLLDQDGLKVLKEIEWMTSVLQGRSELVGKCDAFGMFFSRNPIYAEFIDGAGNVLSRSLEYTCPDRHSWFPEACISMHCEDDTLVLRTDKIARWVELEGDAQGDAFGWYFEDNFFDLVPGEEKRVRLLGRHREGVITAKPWYSPHVAHLTLGMQDSGSASLPSSA